MYSHYETWNHNQLIWCSPCEDPTGRGSVWLTNSKEPNQWYWRRTRKATGWQNINSKQKEQLVINIMDWNAEEVFNRRDDLQHFLHENNVNICCIQRGVVLLECANYGPAPPTSALRVSVRITSPLASGIWPFLEAQEGHYRSQAWFILRVSLGSLSLSIHKTVEL
jgi:hypothetical protein